MKFRMICSAVFALAASSAVAAPVNLTTYAGLSGSQIVTFDDIAGGSAPGTNYNGAISSNGVGLGERFVGQTVTPVGSFDQLGGAPTGPLALAFGAANQNLNVFLNGGSQVLTGLGTLGFPDFDAIGEGAFSVLFSSDQSQFGFQLVGGNGGDAFLSFFRADGSLISNVTLSGLADNFYGFSREGGLSDIRGISIWNTDPGGIGFDNLKHDVASNIPAEGAVPEPSTWAMLILGFAGVGFMSYRRSRRNPGLTLVKA